MRADHWVVGFDGFVGALMGEGNSYAVHTDGREQRSNAGRWSARGSIVDIEVETGMDLQNDAETEEGNGLDEI